MKRTSVLRSAVFVMLGSLALCAQAFAQGPALRLGAVNDVVGPIQIDGRFTGSEWAAVRPVASKLDDTTGGLFNTLVEDPTLDSLAYIAPGSGVFYFLYDLPVLKATAPPPAGKVLLTVTIPRQSGPFDATFVAVGGGTYDVTFVGPAVNGLQGAASRFVPAPHEDGVPHFQFELAIPQSDIQNLGDQVIWTTSRTTVINHTATNQTLNRLETLPIDPQLVVLPVSDVPLAANSVTQYIRDTLSELRPRLTRAADRARLNEAIAHVTKALSPGLYLDEGHLTPRHGEKVFRFDQDAVRTLNGLLRRLGFTESLPPDLDAVPTCSSNVPAEGVVVPLYACAQALFAVDRELADTAVFAYRITHPGSQTLARADARLTEGDEDWNAGEVEAIDDYGDAWDIVTPQP